MILFQVPIHAKHTLKIIKNWCWDLAHLKKSKKNSAPAKFSFVYFAYQPDFEYMLLSLKSLVKNVDHLADIFLFIDQKAPFSQSEEQAFIAVYPNIKLRPVYNFSWASIETTMAEINSFLEVSKQSNDEDYLVKVDSDILFLAGSKFERIAYSGIDTFGDTRHINYQYYQGGLYGIKHKLVKEAFGTASASDFEAIAKDWHGNLGEDLAVSERLRRKGISLNNTRLMLFPSEYPKIKRANKFLRWEFAALHFIKDKENMEYYFNNFINEQ